MKRRWKFPYTPGSIILFILLLFPLATMLFPFSYMVGVSLKPDGYIIRQLSDLFPLNPTLDNYKTVLQSANFDRYFLNSVFVSSSIVLGNVFFCTLMGYTFAKKDFPGKNVFFVLLLSSLMIPFQVTMVPLYKLMNAINWLDTYRALIVPSLVTPFGVFLMRQYIQGLPTELIYAARVDGANEFRIVWRIIFPLCRPAISVLIIIVFLSSWNDFLSPLILTKSADLRTLPLGLAQYSLLNQVQWVNLMAASCISLLPIFFIFLIFQRQIISGLVSGAIKD